MDCRWFSQTKNIQVIGTKNNRSSKNAGGIIENIIKTQYNAG
jgi:hypothetical protein